MRTQCPSVMAIRDQSSANCLFSFSLFWLFAGFLVPSCPKRALTDFVRTLNLHPDDPVSRQVKAIIKKFQQSTSMKMNLPLMELEAAREDMEGFLQSCLCEISSQLESRELIKELSQKLSAHASRV